MTRTIRHAPKKERCKVESAAERLLADLMFPLPAGDRLSDDDLAKILESRPDSAGLTETEWLALLDRLRRMDLDPDERRRPKPIPTRAVPGSQEKIEVLARRYELGQELHHPLDLGGSAYL